MSTSRLESPTPAVPAITGTPRRHRRSVVAAAVAVVIPLLGAAPARADRANPHDRVSLGAARGSDAQHSTSRLHNLAPTPNYFNTCVTDGANSRGCITQVVAAIENARSLEHVKKRKLILPDNYAKLPVPEQTFVVTDLERVDRGLRPYAGLSKSFNLAAQSAALLQVDPTLPSTMLRALHVDWLGSIWAGDLGPLASDYDWMYNDGYSKAHGINLACTVRGAAGCWGHRNIILYPASGLSNLSAGAGTAKPAGRSIAEVLVGSDAPRPHYMYTWKQALAHGADGHRSAK